MTLLPTKVNWVILTYMKKVLGLVLLSVTILLVSSAIANAGPMGPTDLSGIQLFATGGVVNIYFVGSDTVFNSVLSLSSPSNLGPFFPNHSTPSGSMVSLGTFAPGTPLTFQLHVLSTGNFFFTGPATPNIDNMVHAGVTAWAADTLIPVNGLQVGFEDLIGGGDRDFNDYLFVVENVSTTPTAVPEPATFMLLGIGLAAIASRKNAPSIYENLSRRLLRREGSTQNRTSMND